MSQSILTSEACLSPSILDLNTLVGKLEETAQALLAVSQTIQSAASNPREHTPTEKRAVEYRTSCCLDSLLRKSRRCFVCIKQVVGRKCLRKLLANSGR